MGERVILSATFLDQEPVVIVTGTERKRKVG
jgi:hypothetical protein